MLHVVTMLQVSKHRWNLISPKNTMMVEGLLLESQFKAEEWVRNYISGFSDWTYVILVKGGQDVIQQDN